MSVSSGTTAKRHNQGQTPGLRPLVTPIRPRRAQEASQPGADPRSPATCDAEQQDSRSPQLDTNTPDADGHLHLARVNDVFRCRPVLVLDDR